MMQVAKIVLEHSFCRLCQAFKVVSPTVRYSTSRAITKLLQMPLVAVQIGNASSGTSFTILLEKFQGTDYFKMASVFNQMTELMKGTEGQQSIDRKLVKMLLNLA